MGTAIVAAVIGLALFAAGYSIYKRHKNGGGCSSCGDSGCPSCPGCHPQHNDGMGHQSK